MCIARTARRGLRFAPLTRLDLAYPDVGADELFHQRLVEGRDGGLGGAVDASPDVGLATGDTAEVDDHLSEVSHHADRFPRLQCR
jgi:hypothetical protein